MRRISWMVLVPAAVLATACGRSNSPAADDALKNDLALASQAQPFNAQPVVSPAEAGYAARQQLVSTPGAVRREPVLYRRARAVRRSSGSSRRSSDGGGYYPSRAEPRTVIVKHTQRDAAIGAAAGAVIGATTSRNRIKGGLIGAAVGGILGGVIGNNVDKQRKVPW